VKNEHARKYPILGCKKETWPAAAYKSPGHAWGDADITGLLSFRGISLEC
jgi:hypothetical protein